MASRVARSVVSQSVFLVLTSAIVAFSQTSASPTVLENGKPIDRELSGGQTHYYVLNLRAGQLCRVIVDQREIDVVVTLYGADSRKLLEVDSPNGRVGPEPVSFVADNDQTYRLEVASAEKLAPAGRYEIRIAELRTATADDKVRITAENTFSDGIQLENQQTAQSRRSAIDKFQQSLTVWKTLKDNPKVIETLSSIGRCYLSLGDPRKSLEFYEEALALTRTIGDKASEAQVLDRVATAYENLGDRSKALELFGRSLELRRAGTDIDGVAAGLNNMGLAYANAGESQKALDCFNEAVPIYKKLGNKSALATTLNNIALTYGYLGEHQKALDIFAEALPIHRSVNDQQMLATTFNNMGVVNQRMGEYKKALEYLSQALPIWEAIGNTRDQGMTLTNIGQNLNELRDYTQATTYLNRALTIHQAGGNRRAQAVTLNNLGIASANLGEPSKARDLYTRSLEISHSINDRHSEAATLYHLARLDREQGNLSDARQRIEQSLAAVESLRADVTSQQLRATYFASVRKYHDFQINLLMRMHKQRPTEGFDALAFEASEMSRARSLLELLRFTRTGIQSEVDPALIERERELRQLISNRADRQTRMLSVRHTEEQAQTAARELETLTTEYDQLQSRIRQANPRYASLIKPVPVTLPTIRQELLDRGTMLLEYALGDDASFLWAITSDSIQSFELPARAQIEASARSFYESLTARNQVLPTETPVQRTARVRTADATYAKASETLSDLLLGPLTARLQSPEISRVVIVSDGMLQYLPFTALRVPAKTPAQALPLIAKHEVASLPSASVLLELRNETASRQPPSKTVAILADPVFDAGDSRLASNGKADTASSTKELLADVRRSAAESGVTNFERLRFSRQEAEDIASLAPAGKKLEALDFSATRALATSPELGNFQIVHFATHGLINTQHPELSGVVLSLVDQQGRSQDGFLRLYEIYNLKLNASLVVLSACQTALGKEVRGEGLVGLTRGFMYAGVPRVIASLWRIDDRASAELMKRFYRLMLGEKMTPAAALKAAQISMSQDKRWEAPYYWAGFTLQGEWK